jgi:hypothetical protein
VVTIFYVIYIACFIIAGHLLNRVVEEPGRDFFRRRWIDTDKSSEGREARDTQPRTATHWGAASQN